MPTQLIFNKIEDAEVKIFGIKAFDFAKEYLKEQVSIVKLKKSCQLNNRYLQKI